jgi:hypothetical protein
MPKRTSTEVIEDNVIEDTEKKVMNDRGYMETTKTKKIRVGEFTLTNIYVSSMEGSRGSSTASRIWEGEEFVMTLCGRYGHDPTVELLEEAFQLALFMDNNNIYKAPNYLDFDPDQSLNLLKAIQEGVIGSARGVKESAELHHSIVMRDPWRRMCIVSRKTAAA